ncbi:MAG TPA: hypothetical protein VM537_32180 [Anaerolineae bacterium]|nr:hypothetical protein [Anaerolineae bacterium]
MPARDNCQTYEARWNDEAKKRPLFGDLSAYSERVWPGAGSGATAGRHARPLVEPDLDSQEPYVANRHVFDYYRGMELQIEETGSGHSGGVSAIDLSYENSMRGRVPRRFWFPAAGAFWPDWS